MANLEIVEGDSIRIPFHLTYGDNWSVVAKRGLPVLPADIDRIIFGIKDKKSDAEPFVQLSTDEVDEIWWTDDEDGRLTVRIPPGSNGTRGHSGVNKPYELRVFFPDGSEASASRGFFDILESVVDEGS